MSKRVCSMQGCANLIDQAGRCQPCTSAADKRRGTATQRGYNSPGHRRFREAVLLADPVCVCPDGCAHHLGATECLTISDTADHYPIERRDLVRLGKDPNAPTAGRGLCKACHDRSTGLTAPGGYNAAQAAS